MKKFHFRHQKIIHHYIKYMDILNEGLKSGKIIGKKIISNAFDLSVSYCFITLDGLKNLVALDYALINDIKYNFLDNTFHFIFDIDLQLNR